MRRKKEEKISLLFSESMKEKIKKIVMGTPKDKIWAAITVAFLIFVLVPLFALSKYVIPFFDDYIYGIHAKQRMTSDFDVINAIKGAYYIARTEWFCYQGTYASDFFMGLMPLIWADGRYMFIGPCFIITTLVIGCFILVGTLLKDIFRAKTSLIVITQSIVTSMVLVLIYTAQQGFYWYIGGVHYVVMHSFLMMLTASLVHIKYSKTRANRVWMVIVFVVLSAIVAGANFVTTLQGIEILSLILLLRILMKEKTWKWLLPSYVMYILGFCQNVFAPGNAGRQIYYTDGFSAPMTIVKSFEFSVKYLKDFTGWITVLIVLLLAPIAWKIAKQSEYEFKFVTLVILGVISLCLYASGFAPSLYSTGRLDLSRVINAIKITFQMLMVICEFYGVGYIYSFCKKNNWRLKEYNGNIAWWIVPIWIVCGVYLFRICPNPIGTYSNFGAMYYVWMTDQAETFHDEYQARVELLESDINPVELEPYSIRPWFLIWRDINEDGEAAEAMGNW